MTKMKFLSRYMNAIKKGDEDKHQEDDPRSPTISAVNTAPRKLNASAAPFHPYYEPAHLCIYNNGVPILTMPDTKDCDKVLHGIEDETLDENFPPTAADAAELEICEDFNEMMAQIDTMEEFEELARQQKGGFFPKRWEARRMLKDRPRAPKHWVQPVKHLPKGSTTTALVGYSRRSVKERQKMRGNENKAPYKVKHMKQSRGRQVRMPIQQPRKMS